jgi:CHAT domain-containing protein
VSTAPSLTVLLGLERRAHAAPREGVFVGVGDVLTGPDDPRLHGAADPVDAPADAPGASADAPTRDGVPARAQLATRLPAAARELRALARRLPTARRRMLTGAEARRDVLLGGALADARWIHVATHGVLDTREPERSGLVLSPVDAAGRPVEGFLSLADVYGLRLRAELVTLSACETALGAEVHGEGLVGLTRGFLYAGAEQVIASLWKVSDDATAELMRGLYDALLDGGRPAADALTAAQRALAAAGRPAYAWAPFTLTGGLVGLDVARRGGADPLSAASRAGPARRSRSTSGPRSR